MRIAAFLGSTPWHVACRDSRASFDMAWPTQEDHEDRVIAGEYSLA